MINVDDRNICFGNFTSIQYKYCGSPTELIKFHYPEKTKKKQQKQHHIPGKTRVHNMKGKEKI